MFNTTICDGCGQETESHYAWVIEADGSYWDGHFADSRGFTRNVDEAIKFVQYQDAEKVKHWLLQAHSFALRTTQHGWANGKERS